MTNSEALEVLKANYPDRCYESLRKAVDVAIKALSVQQGIEKLTCAGCKWEFEIAKECEECARVMPDNYKEAKKELTFSERQKIVRKFEEWCSSNDAANCAESFLAYLIVEGYIDG